MADEKTKPETEVKQRASTIEDYFNLYSSPAVQFNNPSTSFNATTDIKGIVDVEDPTFKGYFDRGTVEDKRAMLNGRNTSDAVKIAQRREIFKDSQKATEQDGIVTQIGMGIIPSLANYSTLLPFGAAYKTAQMSNTASRLVRGARVAGVGAITGATANLADEFLFEMQGMPTSYMSAAGVGFVLGGGLGFLGGALSGPYNKSMANAMDPSTDTLGAHYEKDPNVIIKVGEDGSLKLTDVGQLDKSILDRVPFVGNWLRSDVHNVYQSESNILRSLMSRVSSPTVSIRDSQGNFIKSERNGMDYKRTLKNHHNNLIIDNTEAYNNFKAETGSSWSKQDFDKEVYRLYISKSNTQRRDAQLFAEKTTGDFKVLRKDQTAREITDIDADAPFIKDSSGKEKPLTEELLDSGTIKQEDIIIKPRTKKVRGKLKEEVRAKEKEDIQLKYKESIDEYYKSNPIKFEGDVNIVRAMDAYKKYFDDMLKAGQDVGVKELKGLSKGRLYAPRMYNYEAIHQGLIPEETIMKQVKDGLRGDSRNKFKTEKDLTDSANHIFNELRKSAFNINNLTNSFLIKELPLGTHLKQRRLYLDESKMPDLLVNDFETVAGMYHYSMSGRQATQYAFGTDDLTQIMDLVREEHLAKGITSNPKDIQAFERSVQDLLGVLRMNELSNTPGWTFTRNLTTFNSARAGGGFGGNQFLEMAAVQSMNAVKGIVSSRFLKSWKSAADLLYLEKKPKDGFSQYLVNSGFMDTALATNRMNRLSDSEMGFNAGFFERKLTGVNDWMMKVNGMRYFTAVMEDMQGGAIVDILKKGSASAEELSRWGLNKAEAKDLQNVLKDVTTTDNWDLSKLSKQQEDNLQLAIQRGVAESVIQADSIHLPSWMKAPTAATRIIFQFMRFPLIAQEVLLRRGLTEDKAAFAAGIAGTLVTFIGMKYMREQASMAIGTTHPSDARYDYVNNPEDMERVLMEGLNYTANLGMFTTLVNYGASITGSPELGRDYTQGTDIGQFLGISAGGIEDTLKIIQDGTQGNINTEEQFQRYKRMVPLLSLPIVSESFKYLAEEYGD